MVVNMQLMNNKKIIAIASGKGGVGKSILSTNIAAGLAMLDKKVILIDCDFGGANLHALFNTPPKGIGLDGLVYRKRKNCKEKRVIQKTNIPNLWLVPGWDYLGVYGLNKEKSKNLNSHINEMKVDYIVMDLSPGHGRNTLDLFINSDIGIIVLTPEITSILNALVFIKFVLLKKFARHVGHNNPIIKTIRSPHNTMAISELLKAIKNFDQPTWKILNDDLMKFEPAIIFNRVSDEDDRKVEKKFINYLKKNYLITPNILGQVTESSLVKDSVKKRAPLIKDQPKSKPACAIKIILHKLLYSL